MSLQDAKKAAEEAKEKAKAEMMAALEAQRVDQERRDARARAKLEVIKARIRPVETVDSTDGSIPE